MTDIIIVFEVHQPFRLRRDFFWEHKFFRKTEPGRLFDYYFDKAGDKEIFNRISKKCYLPANSIILRTIDEIGRGGKPFKVSFSISGVFVEQCELFNRDVLDSFRQLAQTGKVEFLEQTYFHSLAGIYAERTEFAEQIRLHKELMQSTFGFEPKVFENTELLYNNALAKFVEKLGYTGIYTEGTERILDSRSPNFIYKAKGCERMKVLLRNYKLTDDIGFRFSARSWSEWPLTADKFASWLSTTPGHCITIFPDYETFGEHHWPETGIHQFLEHLPGEILRHDNLETSTPSDVLSKHSPVGEIDVPEPGVTISWADMQRDTSGWLGNSMQWACYNLLLGLEPIVKESDDSELLKMWRYFQVSDHLYYMYAAGGGPGTVHSYFSPHQTPVDAFVTFHTALLDLEAKVRQQNRTANEPFRFHTGSGDRYYTGVSAWSLKGVAKAVSHVTVESIEYHNSRGDFELWARFSLIDAELARQFAKVAKSGMVGNELRRALLKVVESEIPNSVEGRKA